MKRQANPKKGDTFGKLIRCERSLERSLFRTLTELRQIQGKHRNRPSSPISDAVTLDGNDTQSQAAANGGLPAERNQRPLRF
jgi:hypothetical protein